MRDLHALDYRAMRIGIDLGGTKIEGIAIADEGASALRRRIAAPRGDYAQHARARSSAWCATSSARPARRGTVGVGIPGTISPATGLIKNANSTWLIGRPLGRGSAAPARSAGAVRQRRQLLRAVGGDRRRGGGRAAWCSASSSAPAPAAASWSTAACWPARTRSPASGDTIRCRRRATASVRGRRATAAGAAASRRFCRARRWRAITRAGGGRRRRRARDRGARARGGDAARDRGARALRGSAWRARSASVINMLDPDVIVLGGGLSNIERLYDACRALWAPYIFSDRVDDAARPRDARRLERRARRGVAVGVKSGSGFRVQGSGFGFGFRVRVQGSRFVERVSESTVERAEVAENSHCVCVLCVFGGSTRFHCTVVLVLSSQFLTKGSGSPATKSARSRSRRRRADRCSADSSRAAWSGSGRSTARSGSRPSIAARQRPLKSNVPADLELRDLAQRCRPRGRRTARCSASYIARRRGRIG